MLVYSIDKLILGEVIKLNMLYIIMVILIDGDDEIIIIEFLLVFSIDKLIFGVVIIKLDMLYIMDILIDGESEIIIIEFFLFNSIEKCFFEIMIIRIFMFFVVIISVILMRLRNMVILEVIILGLFKNLFFF